MKVENIWLCKIGGPIEGLPPGSDAPMRRAIEREFVEVTGHSPKFIFSGWGGELTEVERWIVEGDPEPAGETTLYPFEALKGCVLADPEYAWSVHCNLAMPIMDSLKCTHEQANRAAADVMIYWFRADMTKHEYWASFERQWAEGSTPSGGSEHG